MPIDADTLNRLEELSGNIKQLSNDIAQTRLSVAQDVARIRLDTAAEIHAFQLVYQERHATLEARVTVIETSNKNYATREEIAALRGDLQMFAEQMRSSSAQIKEALNSFETIKDGVAYRTDIATTQNDVDWLKRHFWQAVALIGFALAALIGLVIQHIASTGKAP